MNIFAIIILCTIIIDYFLHLYADFLNISVLKDDVPEAFCDIYDRKKYKKSQLYLRATTKFSWVISTTSLIILLLFWFCRGFSYLDLYVRGFNLGPVLTGLIYIAILLFLKTLISLPFSIYSTFVIEEKFGFNKTTIKVFITDILKGLIIGILLGVPIMLAILAFFQYFGSLAWLYCWIIATLFILIVQFIAPTWIMPLFNKFKPIEDQELKDAIFSYAKSINFPLKNVFVMDGSKRSTKSNAFFTGFGKNKRIVLFDTLIKNHSTNDLIAILAHEMGHYKKNHIKKMLIFSIINLGIMFFLLSFFISSKGLFNAFYMTHISVYAGLIFFGMLFSPIEFFINIFLQIYLRKNEYEADYFAVKTTKDSKSLINALKTLSVDNLSNLLPHRLYVFLNYSHPPVLDRIKSVEKINIS